MILCINYIYTYTKISSCHVGDRNAANVYILVGKLVAGHSLRYAVRISIHRDLQDETHCARIQHLFVHFDYMCMGGSFIRSTGLNLFLFFKGISLHGMMSGLKDTRPPHGHIPVDTIPEVSYHVILSASNDVDGLIRIRR